MGKVKHCDQIEPIQSMNALETAFNSTGNRKFFSRGSFRDNYNPNIELEGWYEFWESIYLFFSSTVFTSSPTGKNISYFFKKVCKEVGI